MEGKMDENGGCFSKRGVGSLFDALGKRFSYIYSNLGFQNRKQQSRQTSTAFRMRKAGSQSLMRFCSQSGLICQVGEKRDEWNSIDGAAKALRGLAEGTKEKKYEKKQCLAVTLGSKVKAKMSHHIFLKIKFNVNSWLLRPLASPIAKRSRRSRRF